jgi:hypothetical protein
MGFPVIPRMLALAFSTWATVGDQNMEVVQVTGIDLESIPLESILSAEEKVRDAIMVMRMKDR